MYGGTNHGYPDGNGGGVMTHVPTEETVYFELIRTSESGGVTLNLFTDAGFSTPVSNGSYSILFSSSSTTTPPTGFRYLVFKARDRSNANECQGYIQDLKFYNGVTSV